MKAFWDDAITALDTPADLARLVDEIQRRTEPTMLFLEHDNGCVLAIGLGAAESILTYAEPNGRTYHSIGQTGREGLLVFRCRDQYDEFLAEMAVPAEVAPQAALAFYENGERPSNLEWESDW